MEEYKLMYRLKQLKKQKINIVKSLQWAVANNDLSLERICESELKVILKESSKINKKLSNLTK